MEALQIIGKAADECFASAGKGVGAVDCAGAAALFGAASVMFAQNQRWSEAIGCCALAALSGTAAVRASRLDP